MTLWKKVINNLLGCVGEEKNDTDLLHQAVTTNTRKILLWLEKYLSMWQAHSDSQMVLELKVLCFIELSTIKFLCLSALR